MAATRKSDISNLLLAGASAIFNKTVKTPVRKYYPEICQEVNESKETGIYLTMGNLGQAQEHNEDSAIVFDKIEESNKTTIVSKVYEKGVKVTVEASEFDQYNVVDQQFGAPLIKVMGDKKEHIVADIYNGVFTATGADGVYQASATHPLKNNPGRYNVNLMSGALTTDNIKKMKNMFNVIRDQSGELYGSRPTHILVNEDKQFEVFELLQSALMAQELSNTKNSLDVGGVLKVILNPFLTISTSAPYTAPWFMLDKSLTGAGCMLQKKKDITLRTWFENAELSLKGIAYEIYGAGMVAPGYGFIASTGA